MMTNSRDKGKRGELEIAKILRNYGYDARRGQQYSGANGDPDVTGIPGFHLEVKRVEKLNLYKAVEQSVEDAREGEIPLVVHRKNNHTWLVTLRLEDMLEVIQRKWEEAMANEILSQDTYTFYVTKIVQDATKAYIWLLVDGTQNMCYVLFKKDIEALKELLAAANIKVDELDANRVIPELLYHNGYCEVGIRSIPKETGKEYYRNVILGFKEAA